MKVTADTITDDQIWELYLRGEISFYRLAMARGDAPTWRKEHRARCAEIYNARTNESDK